MNHGTVVVDSEDTEEEKMTVSKETEAEILRLYYAEKWKVNTIADQLNLHHSTVERVLSENGVSVEKLKVRPSIVDPYIPFIKDVLNKYPRLNATRIFRMAKERGYPGGVDHFRDIVARLRPRPAAEAYLKLSTLPGEQAQVDWGSFGKMKFGEHERKLYAFVMVLSWSRQIFLRFYLNQGTGNFLRGHVEAFNFFGGVSREILYDNLKSVVIDRIDRAIRFNPAILEFASYYKYKPVPVDKGKPTQKGKVERGIRYVRSSFFAGRKWNGLEDLNAQALAWCQEEAANRLWTKDGRSIVGEAFEQEKGKLILLPDAPYPVYDRKEVKVGKVPYAAFDANEYTIPHEHIKRFLTVMATLEEVQIFDENLLIARHKRSFGKKERIENTEHIEKLLDQKRSGKKHRAIDRLRAAVPSCEEFLERAASRGHNLGRLTQDLTRLLDLYGVTEFEAAVKHCLEADTAHSHAVTQSLELRRSSRGLPPPVKLHFESNPAITNLVVKPNSLSTYDKLMKYEKENESDD